jgi:hypothetical protein
VSKLAALFCVEQLVCGAFCELLCMHHIVWHTNYCGILENVCA